MSLCHYATIAQLLRREAVDKVYKCKTSFSGALLAFPVLIVVTSPIFVTRTNIGTDSNA